MLGKAMKHACALALGVLLLASGCGRVSYTHPVVAEGNGLRVVERSSESKSSQGKPLSGAKIGLPTKSLIQRVEYAIDIKTPLNAIPVMFLRAHDSAGSDLRLNGAHLHELDKRSAGSLDGDRYTFYLDAAKGLPLEFDVITPAGTVLGHEKIEYRVVSRGHIWVVEGT